MEETNPMTVPRPRSGLGLLIENILYILAAIGLAMLIQAYVVRPFIVSGTSMDPIIKHGQYLIIDEVSYRFKEPERGDVIVFKSPPEPSKYYIKRIIGLPGETIIINGTKVTIKNKEHPKGFVLDESFITHYRSEEVTAVVPKGEYYVLGDNRDGSYDSRSWGSVPFEDIRGRALLRLFPIDQIDYLPGKITYENNE